MTRTGPDRRGIDTWRTELVQVIERSRRLDGDPTRQLLAGTTLTGHSAQRWSTVEAELAGVWVASLAVTDRLDELEVLLRRSPWRRRRWRTAAERLITDPGIDLTGAVGSAPRATADRPEGEPHDLRRLLSDMHDCLDRAEATVARADWSWSTARASLSEARTRLEEVVASAKHQHVRIPATVRHAVASLEAMETHASTNPFDVDPEHVDALLVDVRARRDELSAAIGEGVTFHQRHTTLLDELNETAQLIGGVRVHCLDVRRRVAVESCSDAVLDGLDQRLIALREDTRTLVAIAPVDWAATGRRMSRVEDRLHAVQRDARSVDDRASAALTERDVLRGRLSSYRARAARSSRGEDRDLEVRHAAAFDALHRAPVDLRASADLVRAYVDGLERAEVQS